MLKGPDFTFSLRCRLLMLLFIVHVKSDNIRKVKNDLNYTFCSLSREGYLSCKGGSTFPTPLTNRTMVISLLKLKLKIDLNKKGFRKKECSNDIMF